MDTESSCPAPFARQKIVHNQRQWYASKVDMNPPLLSREQLQELLERAECAGSIQLSAELFRDLVMQSLAALPDAPVAAGTHDGPEPAWARPKGEKRR
jgi:hypothetical protein